MMRSMFSSVSSLRAHQARMDTIANNISNVNTIGYKTASADFAESFSQTLQGASSASGGRGGTNPMQIGLGANISSINVRHTVGSTQRTDNPTDLSIQGQGFFVVTDDPTYQNRYFTRAGNFSLTSTGHLVTSDGLHVLGMDNKPIEIDRAVTVSAEPTTEVRVHDNISINDVPSEEDPLKPVRSVNFNVYDSLGETHPFTVDFGEVAYYKPPGDKLSGSLRNIRIIFGKSGEGDFIPPIPVPNPPTGPLTIPQNPPAPGPINMNPVGDLTPIDYANATISANSIYAHFDAQGKFVGIVQVTAVAEDPQILQPLDPGVPAEVISGKFVTEIKQIEDMSVTFRPNGADEMKIQIVTPPAQNAPGGRPKTIFDKLTQFNLASNAVGEAVNGRSPGQLNDFNISQGGEIVGTFTNGQKTVLQTISMAKFDNPEGLEKVGDNRFTKSPNSGEPKYAQAGTTGIGTLRAGTVEMSNVDLSQEFSNMITTQRGFQANSRIITASDEMLQELVNLKR